MGRRALFRVSLSSPYSLTLRVSAVWHKDSHFIGMIYRELENVS